MSDEIGEAESLMNTDQLGVFRSMLARLEMPTSNKISRMSDGRLRHIVIDDGESFLHVRFNLVQDNPRPQDRRHFFESLEFRVMGRPDGDPAVMVWHENGERWIHATWRDGQLIKHSVVSR